MSVMKDVIQKVVGELPLSLVAVAHNMGRAAGRAGSVPTEVGGLLLLGATMAEDHGRVTLKLDREQMAHLLGVYSVGERVVAAYAADLAAAEPLPEGAPPLVDFGGQGRPRNPGGSSTLPADEGAVNAVTSDVGLGALLCGCTALVVLAAWWLIG